MKAQVDRLEFAEFEPRRLTNEAPAVLTDGGGLFVF